MIGNSFQYLRHAHFYIITNHCPLFNPNKIDPKIDAAGCCIHGYNKLNLHNFEVVYKKERKHSNADAMNHLTHYNDYAEDQ